MELMLREGGRAPLTGSSGRGHSVDPGWDCFQVRMMGSLSYEEMDHLPGSSTLDSIKETSLAFLNKSNYFSCGNK